MVRAGERRHVIWFQKQTETANDFNEKVATWANAAKYWAQINGQGGRELIRAQQVQPHATHVLTVRSDSFTRALTTEYRVKIGTRQLGIISITDEDGTRRELKIVCAEEV